jgi:hypothetical protein
VSQHTDGILYGFQVVLGGVVVVLIVAAIVWEALT